MATLTLSQQATFKALVLRDGAACVWCGAALGLDSKQTRVSTLVRRQTASAPRILANSLLSCVKCDHARGGMSASEWLFVCIDSGRRPNWEAVASATALLASLSRTRYKKRTGPWRAHIAGESNLLCAGRYQHERGTIGKRRRLVARDGPGCLWCAKDLSPADEDCTVEHIIPRVYGGKNITENTACACGHCNSHRRAKSIADWTAECERRGLRPRWEVLTPLLETLSDRSDASGRYARRELAALAARAPTL